MRKLFPFLLLLACTSGALGQATYTETMSVTSAPSNIVVHYAVSCVLLRENPANGVSPSAYFSVTPAAPGSVAVSYTPGAEVQFPSAAQYASGNVLGSIQSSSGSYTFVLLESNGACPSSRSSMGKANPGAVLGQAINPSSLLSGPNGIQFQDGNTNQSLSGAAQTFLTAGQTGGTIYAPCSGLLAQTPFIQNATPFSGEVYLTTGKAGTATNSTTPIALTMQVPFIVTTGTYIWGSGQVLPGHDYSGGCAITYDPNTYPPPTGPPATPTATAHTSGGGLPDDKYFIKLAYTVNLNSNGAGNVPGFSAASQEVTATVSGGGGIGSITIPAPATPGCATATPQCMAGANHANNFNVEVYVSGAATTNGFGLGSGNEINLVRGAGQLTCGNTTVVDPNACGAGANITITGLSAATITGGLGPPEKYDTTNVLIAEASNASAGSLFSNGFGNLTITCDPDGNGTRHANVPNVAALLRNNQEASRIDTAGFQGPCGGYSQVEFPGMNPGPGAWIVKEGGDDDIFRLNMGGGTPGTTEAGPQTPGVETIVTGASASGTTASLTAGSNWSATCSNGQMLDVHGVGAGYDGQWLVAGGSGTTTLTYTVTTGSLPTLTPVGGTAPNMSAEPWGICGAEFVPIAVYAPTNNVAGSALLIDDSTMNMRAIGTAVPANIWLYGAQAQGHFTHNHIEVNTTLTDAIMVDQGATMDLMGVDNGFVSGTKRAIVHRTSSGGRISVHGAYNGNSGGGNVIIDDVRGITINTLQFSPVDYDSATFVHKIVLGSLYTNNGGATFSNVLAANPNGTLGFGIEANEVGILACKLLVKGTATTAVPSFQFTGPSSPTLVVFHEFATLTNGGSPTFYNLGISNASFSNPLAPAAIVTTGTSGACTYSAGPPATTDCLPVELDAVIANGSNAGFIELQGRPSGSGILDVEPLSYCSFTPKVE